MAPAPLEAPLPSRPLTRIIPGLHLGCDFLPGGPHTCSVASGCLCQAGVEGALRALRLVVKAAGATTSPWPLGTWRMTSHSIREGHHYPEMKMASI